MTSPLRSLIQCGTKLWLDSIDPDLVAGQPGPGGDRGHVQSDHRLRPDQDRPLRRQLDELMPRGWTTTRSPGR